MTRPASNPADPPLDAVEKQVAAGEFEAVEEAWMAHLEKDSKDVTYFATVARALSRAGEADTARFLLELLDEQLTDRGEWQTRLEMLRRTGPLMIDAEELHPAILETLEEIYGHLPSYRQLVDKVGLHRAVDDLPKTWKKAERLAGLLALDVGSIVHMDGKGAGRVEEVNMALESFKVLFEGDLEIRVGFGGATKLLEPLDPDHVLHRKLEEPDALVALRDEAPSDLLHAVFESYDTPLTGAQIKKILAGIVPESRWSSWWATARKHPQVIVAPGSKRAYAWAASSEDAQNVVWQSFEKAKPRTRMDLLRRDGARDGGLKTRMSEALAEQAAELAAAKPGLACEIWFTLERHGELPPAAEWSPRALIAELKDPRALFAGIRDRTFREQAYALLREHRQDWPELYAQLLWQEHDPRSLDLLAEALVEDTPQLLDSFLDQILSQPKRNPAAFVWLAERAAERSEWLERSPIRLLKQILWTLTDGAFSSYRSRLIPLADSGGTLVQLLSALDQEQAAEAETAITKATGLESYQRRPLINAVHLKFPDLRQEDEAPLYATPEMIEAKRAELKELAEVEIPANRRAIEEARELGDLSENFEYKSARQRHEYLSARAAKLNHDLGRVRRIDPTQVTGDEVVIGSRVKLAAADGGRRTITILGPWESEPEKDVLSSESELAQSLLGLAAGDRAEVGGKPYRVESIEPYT